MRIVRFVKPVGSTRRVNHSKDAVVANRPIASGNAVSPCPPWDSKHSGSFFYALTETWETRVEMSVPLGSIFGLKNQPGAISEATLDFDHAVLVLHFSRLDGGDQ